jgi:hypothetical protein
VAGFALALVFTSTASAQGVYFDIGVGVGSGTTKIDNTDITKYVYVPDDDDDVSVDVGFRIGYGPIADMPLYIVGDFGGIGHRFEKGSDWTQFNSYIFGPGVIYYPIPLMQLGLSVGYSWVVNGTSYGPVEIIDKGNGYAWNISTAVDFGWGNHGCLIGLKYFSATNKLKLEKVDQNQSMIGVFVRYAYRHKTVSLSE